MKKKKKSFPKKSALLLTASALLLIGSTVGSTRAALTYYSENYSAQIEMQNIGVSLLENGDVVSSQDFTSKNQQEVKDGELLTGLLGKNEKFAPGKKYKEELSVQNSGNIDTFVRVILTKGCRLRPAANSQLAGQRGQKEHHSFTGSDRTEFPYR